LQPFSPNFGLEIGKAYDVATWPRKAFDKTLTERVGAFG
jgi:hypothetical protein